MRQSVEIEPIAYFRSPMSSKFGIPRQSGIVPELEGCIVFRPEYRNEDAVRGLEGYDFLWLIWGFSANPDKETGSWSPTVRPPRLGGNKAMGVFATRSPFRPNPLGLSSVRISRIEHGTPEGTVIHVSGADLMDGTPVYDIKPYIAYTDSHPDARSGFTGASPWKELEVVFPEELQIKAEAVAGSRCAGIIAGLLSQDPRPKYHDDENRIYGMPYGGMDVRFIVKDGQVIVKEIVEL